MRSKRLLILMFGVVFGACRGDTWQKTKGVTDDHDWNYTDQDAWKHVPGWYCNGIRQSPTNIDVSDAVINHDLVDLKLWNFEQSYSGTFSNTGHSVRFDPAAGSPAVLFQNHLGTYRLLQFHFHWGQSENKINGNGYSGEIHFVTQQVDGISTTGDAYAVLGGFLTSDDSVPITGTWMQLYTHIPPRADVSVPIVGVQLTDLLPESYDYYHYEGSLTTPPCTEIVRWFVLQNAVHAPKTFMDTLQSHVFGEDGHAVTMNYRYTQPLNGRQVMIKADCDGYDSNIDNNGQQ